MMPVPAVLLSRSASEAAFALTLAPECEAFRGHFPGDPILPGVVQVDWAIRLGLEVFGELGPFRGLDQLKFLAPIRPLEAVALTLALEPGRLRFEYACGATRKASGLARFGGAP
jgi:3-hydroxymyristoyl/3-hydroxydecanoyl-(acyl carrier protein) dehydratase